MSHSLAIRLEKEDLITRDDDKFVVVTHKNSDETYYQKQGGVLVEIGGYKKHFLTARENEN